MTETLNYPNDPPVTAHSERLPLVVEDLAVRLKGFTLGPLTFALQPGQVTALLGHNGAGKTTTMRLIMGLMRKDAGSVRLGTLTHNDEIPYRSRIGFVPEEAQYYGQLSVAELVKFVSAFYPEWDASRCEKLKKMLSLDFSKKIRHLSKGTRMKVSLLLALTRDPALLLLDEPTSGLDPRSRAEVLQMIRSAAKTEGQAVLFSTHNLSEGEQVADHLLVVDHGRVIANESVTAAKSHLGPDGKWTLESYYLGLVQ